MLLSDNYLKHTVFTVVMIKDLKGWPGYKISDKGIIWGKRLNKPLRPNSSKTSHYLQVVLSNGEVKKRLCVHKLVAENFISNPECHFQVNHIDGNKKNNEICNLEWCSAKGNVNHAFRTGLINTSIPIYVFDVLKGIIIKFSSKNKFLEFIDSSNWKFYDRLHKSEPMRNRYRICLFENRQNRKI